MVSPQNIYRVIWAGAGGLMHEKTHRLSVILQMAIYPKNTFPRIMLI